MAARSVKQFRIEAMLDNVQGETHTEADKNLELSDILSAIHQLRDNLEPAQTLNDTVLEDFHRELQEAARMKVELDNIRNAIDDTKKEIASLHVEGLSSDTSGRFSDELGAVITGTEKATEEILSATELIEDRAATLIAKLKGDDQGVASDIHEQVVRIFEACNFQDITGQRITKVVSALHFIEQRVTQMTEIWGGMEKFATIEVAEPQTKQDSNLLNGPALESDTDVASQDDIDALFP